jgi:hypothetical protein
LFVEGGIEIVMLDTQERAGVEKVTFVSTSGVALKPPAGAAAEKAANWIEDAPVLLRQKSVRQRRLP